MAPTEPRTHGALPLSDRDRLEHMRAAAREAAGFAAGKTLADIQSDRLLNRGLTHCLLELGEAAAKVTEPTRELLPSIPWRQIVGMRHRLVHVYCRTDPALVYEVVARDLPVLLSQLDSFLSDQRDTSS